MAVPRPPHPKDRFDLDGRVAIVTGGSRGLGRAIAGGFAAAGARVVVASRKGDRCAEAAAEITAAGGEALGVACHVGDDAQRRHLVEAAVDRFGGIDIVVNNAANALGLAFDDLTPLAFEKTFATNVFGPVLLAQAALPHLEASGRGVVINVISVGAFNGAPYLSLYVAGKAALLSLTKSMAKELAPRGIRVNALAPGPFDTDMVRTMVGGEAAVESVRQATAQGRIADPSEVVGAALFLASDASSFVTGAPLIIDGGLSA